MVLKKEFLQKIETEEYKQLINEIMEYNYDKAIEMQEINDKNAKSELIEINDNISEKKKGQLKMTIFTSLKYPSLRYKFLILCILWFGTRSTSNCIALSSKSLPGNYYYNIIFLFIFESLAYYGFWNFNKFKIIRKKRHIMVTILNNITYFYIVKFYKNA